MQSSAQRPNLRVTSSSPHAGEIGRKRRVVRRVPNSHGVHGPYLSIKSACTADHYIARQGQGRSRERRGRPHKSPRLRRRRRQSKGEEEPIQRAREIFSKAFGGAPGGSGDQRQPTAVPQKQPEKPKKPLFGAKHKTNKEKTPSLLIFFLFPPPTSVCPFLCFVCFYVSQGGRLSPPGKEN